jgi:hypothetical protein
MTLVRAGFEPFSGCGIAPRAARADWHTRELFSPKTEFKIRRLHRAIWPDTLRRRDDAGIKRTLPERVKSGADTRDLHGQPKPRRDFRPTALIHPPNVATPIRARNTHPPKRRTPNAKRTRPLRTEPKFSTHRIIEAVVIDLESDLLRHPLHDIVLGQYVSKDYINPFVPAYLD